MLARVVSTTEQPQYMERPSLKQVSAPKKRALNLEYNENINIEKVKDEGNTF